MSVLAVENLSVSIGGSNRFNDASFDVNAGDVVLLTGPNGCGKSTLIKILVGGAFEYDRLEFTGSARYKNGKDILESERENELFRKAICYVSQEDDFESESVLDCYVNSISFSIKDDRAKYVFDYIKRFSIQDCFVKKEDSREFAKKLGKVSKKVGICADNMDETDRAVIRYLSMNTKKMSGGERKLTNIFSNLIRYSFSDLILLDEPLNNLDFGNVRNFSNILTKIHRAKPELAIVLVTHCRSIPIVNRILEINPQTKKISEGTIYSCSSCFGEIDSEGFYI